MVSSSDQIMNDSSNLLMATLKPMPSLASRAGLSARYEIESQKIFKDQTCIGGRPTAHSYLPYNDCNDPMMPGCDYTDSMLK